MSHRPLYILAFLLPLIVAYEIGYALSVNALGTSETVAAFDLLLRFFEMFGVFAVQIPAIALVVVLFTWHVMSRDSWRIRLGVLVGMAAESFVWTMPMFAALVLLGTSAPAMQAGADVVAAAGGSESWIFLGTIAIGAGLYEELLFRMLLISGVHALLSDLFGVASKTASLVAVLVSAIAFAAYHDVARASIGAFLMFMIAGLYFGVIYLARGFGIAVGVHAAYDLIVLLVLADPG